MKKSNDSLIIVLFLIFTLGISGVMVWDKYYKPKEQKIVLSGNENDGAIKEEIDYEEILENADNDVVENNEKKEQQEDIIQQENKPIEETKPQGESEPQVETESKKENNPQQESKSQDEDDEVTAVKNNENKQSDNQVQKVEKKTSYKLNDRDDMVKDIQKKLNKFGYNIIVDGIFGNDTYYAVVDFQRRAGLGVDGVVGPATIGKLNLPPTDDLMYKPSDDTAAQPGNSEIENFINSEDNVSKTSYFIYTDTDNFSVYIFEGKTKNWKLTKTLKCTVGAPSTPTKKGRFTVGIKGPMFRVSKNVICKYYTQYSGNYLFHTVLLNNDGKIVDGRLGKRLSHGCIRLAIEDAKYIYDNIPPGTAVWVK